MLRAFDGFMARENLQDFAEGYLIVVAVGQDGFHQRALLRIGRFQRVLSAAG